MYCSDCIHFAVCKKRENASINNIFNSVEVEKHCGEFKTEREMRAEAIKEFAERLKKRLERKYTVYGREYVLRHMRELVKEITEDM